MSLHLVELMPFCLSCNASVGWFPLFYLVCYSTESRLHQRWNLFSCSAQSAPNFSPSLLVFLRKFRYLGTLLGNKGVYSICIFFFSCVTDCILCCDYGWFFLFESIIAIMGYPLGCYYILVMAYTVFSACHWHCNWGLFSSFQSFKRC